MPNSLIKEKNMNYVTSFERLSREEGIHLNAITIAKKLIAQGRSIQYIHDLTHLSENEVMDLVDKR